MSRPISVIMVVGCLGSDLRYARMAKTILVLLGAPFGTRRCSASSRLIVIILWSIVVFSSVEIVDVER